MSTPVHARNWKYSHFGRTRVYDVPGMDKPFPSVTSVIGMKDKPALVQWAANMSAKYATQHRDALIDLPAEGAESAIKGNWRTVRDKAANFGTEVHELIEKGQFPLPGTDAEGYVNQAAFVLEEFDVIAQEVTLLNLEEGYAGTVDAWAIHTESKTSSILDWKTGGLYESAALQLVALMNCGHFIDTKGEIGKLPGPFASGYAVQLKEDSYRIERIDRDSSLGFAAFECFKGLLPVWEYTTSHGEHPWEREQK